MAVLLNLYEQLDRNIDRGKMKTNIDFDIIVLPFSFFERVSHG